MDKQWNWWRPAGRVNCFFGSASWWMCRSNGITADTHMKWSLLPGCGLSSQLGSIGCIVFLFIFTHKINVEAQSNNLRYTGEVCCLPHPVATPCYGKVLVVLALFVVGAIYPWGRSAHIPGTVRSPTLRTHILQINYFASCPGRSLLNTALQ